MSRWILLISVLSGPWLMAQEPVLSVGVAAGYERQDFRWSIAGNPAGQDPNVYSELKWHGAGGVSGRVDLRWKVWRRWQVFANGGYSEAGAVGAGFCLLDEPGFRLVPFAGFRISKEYFPIVGAGGPFAGLNSYYSAKWLGPFVKVEAERHLVKRWRISADVVYDQVVYRGLADWNLIADFSHPVSFRHRADGYGVEGELRIGYMLGKHLELFLAGDCFHWETGTGIDMLYLNTGAVQQTQLNGVVRNGVGARLGVYWEL